ncbi:MAG: helix-turn-helix domain-containing protein [Acidimicrobiia bacterium]|nr:helix-turn-helix domain-containing protein [Acidimicrobiia bacterium]
MAGRQRLGFHLLMVCVSGHGTHDVDFEPVELSVGTCLRVHPGQVHRFVSDPPFEAYMVVWPDSSHPPDPVAPVWYPGCNAATSWHLDEEPLAKLLATIDELRYEQGRFDGSPRQTALMQALLASLLFRLAIEIPESVPDAGRLPQAYLDYRERIEERVYQRPTVLELARDLGYSSRTLDRACRQVSGETAKQVLDGRISLEIRRVLTHTDRPISRIAADFEFHDPSNFSKFVKRHLGDLPGHIRQTGQAAPTD